MSCPLAQPWVQVVLHGLEHPRSVPSRLAWFEGVERIAPKNWFFLGKKAALALDFSTNGRNNQLSP
jgi:hypothetical protein